MKHIYSILVALFVVLIANTSCDEDYRDMVLFEGVEPIYQIGTCNNLLSSLTLYLTHPDGVVLGIDGGDGDYSLEGVDVAVATVELVETMNNYSRIKVTPKAEGIVTIRVNDGSGASTVLRIMVRDRFKFFFFVEHTTFLRTEEIEGSLWNQIMSDLSSALTVKPQGSYTLIPADTDGTRGELHINPSAYDNDLLTGTYEMLKGEGGEDVFRFSYNGEVHEFTNRPLGNLVTRESLRPMPTEAWYEDVTSLSAVAVPQGCKVYRAEHWMYLPDTPMANE